MVKKKKIALLGNMNNNFSAICRYLLDCGYDAKLFTFDYEKEYPHFHPSADCYDDSWKSFTHELSWGSAKTFLKVDRKYLQKFFEEFDIIIGCGYAPAFVHKADRRLDVFVPHGSDINHLPYLEKYYPKDVGRFLFVGRNQKSGIVRARHVFCDRWTEDLERKINRLNLQGKRHFSIMPAIYTPQYLNLEIDANEPVIGDLVKIRSNSDLIIFHHIRHSWVNPVDKIAMKSNNYLFEGVAKYKKQNKKPVLLPDEETEEHALLLSFNRKNPNLEWQSRRL